MANHKKQRQSSEPIKTQTQASTWCKSSLLCAYYVLTRGKMCASRLVLVLLLIGWQSCANQIKRELLQLPKWKPPYVDIGNPCYVQLKPVKLRHPLTSTTWPYKGSISELTKVTCLSKLTADSPILKLFIAHLDASPSNIVSFGKLKWNATVKALSNKPAWVNSVTLSCADSKGPETRYSQIKMVSRFYTTIQLTTVTMRLW